MDEVDGGNNEEGESSKWDPEVKMRALEIPILKFSTHKKKGEGIFSIPLIAVFEFTSSKLKGKSGACAAEVIVKVVGLC